MAIMVQQQPNNLKQEITFEKNGFIGIFDNVFEDEYIDELIKFFESRDGMNFVQNSSANGNLKIDRDMDEMFLDDIATIQTTLFSKTLE